MCRVDCFWGAYGICDEPWTCEDCNGYIGLEEEKGEIMENRYLGDIKKISQPIKEAYKRELLEILE